MSLSSAPVARQSSQWTWALYSHCGVHQRNVTNRDPPATTATCQLLHTTCQRTTNTMPLWQQMKPPSIWSWALNLRDAGKMQERLLFAAALPYFFLVWSSVLFRKIQTFDLSCFFGSYLSGVIPLCHQYSPWATSFPVPSLLSYNGLHSWAGTICSAGGRRRQQWAGGPAVWLAARPPPKHTLLLLQRLGQLAVEHLELSHGRQHVQRSHQPHQLGGQLLHHRQCKLCPLAGCRYRDHECRLSVRWVEKESLHESKLCSPLPGQPDALCQWQGRASPHFKSMDCYSDFEIMIIK